MCGLTASMQPAFDAAWGGAAGMYAQRLGRAAGTAPQSVCRTRRCRRRAGVRFRLAGDPDAPVGRDPRRRVSVRPGCRNQPGSRVRGTQHRRVARRAARRRRVRHDRARRAGDVRGLAHRRTHDRHGTAAAGRDGPARCSARGRAANLPSHRRSRRDHLRDRLTPTASGHSPGGEHIAGWLDIPGAQRPHGQVATDSRPVPGDERGYWPDASATPQSGRSGHAGSRALGRAHLGRCRARGRARLSPIRRVAAGVPQRRLVQRGRARPSRSHRRLVGFRLRGGVLRARAALDRCVRGPGALAGPRRCGGRLLRRHGRHSHQTAEPATRAAVDRRDLGAARGGS